MFLEEEIRKAEKQAKKASQKQKKADNQAEKDNKAKPNQVKKAQTLNNSKAKPNLKIGFEDGVKSITPHKLNSLLEMTKVSFPSDPIIWLKDLASYLNVEISEPSDAIFANGPFGEFNTCSSFCS